MRFDVIVVGAGPAGSTAARECAERGMSVLLLDRAEFPRDKPCGGGVNVRAARLLPFDLAPVTERTIHGMRISVNLGGEYDRVSSEPLTYLTQRRLLDTFLVQKATEGGAQLREKAIVRAVERSDRAVTVRTGSDTFTGSTLVAADGANGPTARLAGVLVRRQMGIALEGNISVNPYPPKWRGTFGIDVGSVPGGYGWLFPKGDHVNIGVGGSPSVGPTLRPRLDAITRYYGYDPRDLWGVRGHPLPVRLPGSPLMDRNVLLVGDAAGLLDPLSGEGIFAAIWSGRSAAKHLAEYVVGNSPNIDGYRRDLARHILPDLQTSDQLRDLFHVMPAAWAHLVRRSSRAWRLLSGLLTGDATYEYARRKSHVVSIAIDLGSSTVRTAVSLRRSG